MTDVAKPASRIIENRLGGALVDSTDSLLVDETVVISKTVDLETQTIPAIAVEFAGRISHTDERAYVLLLFDPSSLPTLVGLLVESMAEQKPAFASGMSGVMQTLLREWEEAE